MIKRLIFTISNDGKTLIMGIETDFTQGGTDLYFANRKEDGTYGLLQNMGKVNQFSCR